MFGAVVPVCWYLFLLFLFFFAIFRGRERGERGVFRPSEKTVLGKGSFRPLGRFFNTGSGSRALPLFSGVFSPLLQRERGGGLRVSRFQKKMEPTNQTSYVPTFDGKASSFLDYEQRVILWDGSTEIPPERRSTLLILHMDPAGRQV